MTWLGYREAWHARRREAESHAPATLPQRVRTRLLYYWALTIAAEPPTPSPWDLRRWRIQPQRETHE